MVFRYRTVFMVITTALILYGYWATDPSPDKSTTIIVLFAFFKTILAITMAFIIMKAINDYPEADTRNLYRKIASENDENDTGAGLALIAKAIVFVGLSMVLAQSLHASQMDTYIPKQAYTYVPMLKAEQQGIWPDHPRPEILAGLVEQESCISLKHKRCFNPKSQLKTSREEGAGFGQITRTFNEQTGAVKMDVLMEMARKYPELRELTWRNVYDRPDLQLRTMVLMSRDNYRKFKDVTQGEALNFADAAYNCGVGCVNKNRRACSISDGCNPAQWFGNVGSMCVYNRVVYNRRACDITAEHVEHVIHRRSAKYRSLMVDV